MNLTKTTLLSTWNSKSLTILFFAYVLISLIAATQGLLAGPKIYIPGGKPYIDYNNYRIFKFSFYHLLQGRDIYLGGIKQKDQIAYPIILCEKRTFSICYG